ncbi:MULTISPECIES: amino acid ABC transporter permease [Mameliella]|uniref:Polar amino acid ABC transporter permease n=1 Tax=Mameliella alba TaxID=561184 RepID=A0A0B3RY26_9RHOB|nr:MULTISPECIES: amino acid ABC transporter permease [Mameliella]KHQ51653.1 Polar amino acid ABC transporter permease [Mameliella alba]MDD9730726.1 amino acid ABC transporter permease [Mameliella sp. AT18]OWV40944.1 amino acid ABC transporter permease [Mameliella alba]OWV53648.1 amino acid ABC transporter permease [Mameliella alba]BBU59292.1 ABC transporter permease [Mameliella alba]
MTDVIPASVPQPSFAESLKGRYFSTRRDTIVSIVFATLALWLGWSLVSWALVNATFGAGQGDVCRENMHGGACWSIVAARWRIVLFGLYPFEEQWRSGLACAIMVVVAILSCVPWFWSPRRLPVLWVAGFAAFYILMRGGLFGLPEVTEQNWGGLALTVFIFAAVVLLGMPLAIVFALLRRSELPWIARTMALVIDTVRSLPLLSIMFTFAIVLPFVLPGWAIGDKLYRVIVGYALFFACYQAEIIRGGMQALPAGQEEAAKALGMTYWQRIGYIILPQAFRNALPPTINQIVITFKETSLVTIIGFFDVMASGRAASGTAEWNFATIEMYVFVGLIFFVFVFSLSRYGAYLERRLRVGTR